ncbi:hypothetical protein RGR602_PB00306 (plasmid) [Rhizobium gallicum bv. gallicum R602sp]|uniref:Uncharacterized protein n=1 Tax=Rhizobium gallicum bv. gallicum R602sp TaxID=1041138 RepID=A0A0B4XAR5_9HYPH|nr:hypothetical protein RGR602_PB00306 [Rhizobium gallicum bv. gallicum R602sp]
MLAREKWIGIVAITDRELPICIPLRHSSKFTEPLQMQVADNGMFSAKPVASDG